MKSGGLALLALLGGLLFLAGWCGRGKKESANQAVREHREAIRKADSVERVLQPQIEAWQDSASRNAAAAEQARNESYRLYVRSRRPSDTISTSHSRPIPDSAQSVADLEDRIASLDSAYILMVRVDSLNQLQLAAKDSVIHAQESIIASLKRVREAGERAVHALRPSRWGCTGGISAGLTLDRQGYTGIGVTCGVRL